ncbi:MAG: hypothetical protein IT239_04275 [Bacteroidia bacterium]|nr:hypothetical protein [Bacteroidia bacterium]
MSKHKAIISKTTDNWADSFFNYSLNTVDLKNQKSKKNKKTKNICCEKYRKGKQCRKCPLNGLV